MSQKNSDSPVAFGSSPVASEKPSILRDLAKHLASKGQPVLLDDNDSSIWLPGVRGELQRMPSMDTSEPTESTLQRVFAQRGVWIASYLLAETPGTPANCYDYLRYGPDYDLETLEKNARRDIRRGMRCFEIRPIDWDELLQTGFDAYRDTESRHGHNPPKPQELIELADRHRGNPCMQLWGAIDSHGLAAWIRVLKANDWAFIISACSRLDVLRDCPNNALVFNATHKMLVEEKLASVSYGISSLQATDNIASLHRFKLRMGFSAVRRYRCFVVRPVLRTLLCTAPASWCWEKLAKARSSSATLSKVAGLSRLLSGREKNPLAWADELED